MTKSERQSPTAKVQEELRKFAARNELQIVDASEFFSGIYQLYLKPSLNQVVEQEVPRIINRDPNFFENQQIHLPRNLEAYLFDLYYDRIGQNGLKAVYHSAKVTFRHIRFFMLDHPDAKELDDIVSGFKEILFGDYKYRAKLGVNS